MGATVLTIIGALIMLVGVIVAYVCEINTSMIYDGEVPLSVGTHIFVIMLFVVVSAVLFLIAAVMLKKDGKTKTKLFLSIGTYAVAGIFFSVASAFHARVRSLTGFYNDMMEAPGWYSGEVIAEGWFATLPGAADQFSLVANVCYVLMVLAAAVSVLFLVLAFKQTASPAAHAGTWLCPRCNRTNPMAPYCQTCGMMRPQAGWSCSRCGAVNPGGQFCQRCGMPQQPQNPSPWAPAPGNPYAPPAPAEPIRPKYEAPQPQNQNPWAPSPGNSYAQPAPSEPYRQKVDEPQQEEPQIVFSSSFRKNQS